MGTCSYHYITTCDGDKTVETGIPFDVSLEHYECYQQITGRTCMKATYVYLYDSTPELAVIVKLGEFYLGMYDFSLEVLKFIERFCFSLFLGCLLVSLFGLFGDVVVSFFRIIKITNKNEWSQIRFLLYFVGGVCVFCSNSLFFFRLLFWWVVCTCLNRSVSWVGCVKKYKNDYK